MDLELAQDYAVPKHIRHIRTILRKSIVATEESNCTNDWNFVISKLKWQNDTFHREDVSRLIGSMKMFQD